MANVINATSTGNGGLVSTGDDSGILNIQTNETTAITITAAQNIGIGTATPTDDGGYGKIVDISGSTGGAVYLHTSTATNYAFLGKYNSSTQLADSGSAGLTFATASGSTPVERMRIDSSGNLLVGTTSSTGAKFDVSQSVNTAAATVLFDARQATTSNQYGIVQRLLGDPNNTSQYIFQGIGNATERATIRSNGGLANYSANNVNLSDQREKKNIELAGSYLTKVCAIPVKTFLYNDQTDTELNLGAIAQDVQAVAPELVMESNWGSKEEPKMRLSIYQTDLQYALMKSIQELKAINDTQAETINALTARVVALEGQ